MTKNVLDPCCGGKMFYFNKSDSRVLFCDIRDIETTLCDGRQFAVKPDMIVNFADMPFKSNEFKLVVFDPPHLTRNTGNRKSNIEYGTLHPTGYQQIKYGSLYGDWREMLKRVLANAFEFLNRGEF